jgi:hypothetical protein
MPSHSISSHDDDTNLQNDPMAQDHLSGLLHTSVSPTSSSILQEKYHMMMKMTLELVQDITKVKEGNRVWTAYGEGICIDTGGSDRSMQVALSFGTLYHRSPEMIHCILTENQYMEAMDHLEQVRKLQWTMQCEQWNVDVVGKHEECVACLFDKPCWTGLEGRSSATSSTNSRKSWFRRKRSSEDLKGNRSATPKHKPCDVCGNPVCASHTIGNQSSGNNFIMCVDCQFDLNRVVNTQTQGNSSSTKGLLDPNHPQLPQTLDRLLQYYIRMVLQLNFYIPNRVIKECGRLLTNSERKNAKVALGTGSLSFVGAALGVAGAAAILTPAGPAILLAAVATSASSAAIQGTHAGLNQFRIKHGVMAHVHAVADKIVGWHGLCLGILNALDELRSNLVQEHVVTIRLLKQEMADQKWKQFQQQRRNLRQQRQKNNMHGNNLWSDLAMGSFHTTRHGLTGVGLTAQMGASYSQVISASIQTVPVVGAAFSVGCMAMDASNIASALNKLSKPSDKAVALSQVEDSFLVHIPSTISPEVEALLSAVQDLRELQAETERTQQQDLIEQELEELNMM